MLTMKIQNELKNKEVTYRGYELLQYLKDTYFSDIKGSELQKLRPLVFKESRDVKQAFEELEKAMLISGEYKNGVIRNVIPNIQILLGIANLDTGIVVVKAEPKKKSVKQEVPEDALSIIKYYNEFPELPRPATATPLVISRIEEKLKFMPVEQIKEAIEFASKQSWLINKGSENWCSMAWVINVINEFSDGGKYRKDSTATTTTESKYSAMMENDSVEVIW
ncbi:MAG: hypothetical protein ACRCX2_20520 [Paraclostridium sp.]